MCCWSKHQKFLKVTAHPSSSSERNNSGGFLPAGLSQSVGWAWWVGVTRSFFSQTTTQFSVPCSCLFGRTRKMQPFLPLTRNFLPGFQLCSSSVAFSTGRLQSWSCKCSHWYLSLTSASMTSHFPPYKTAPFCLSCLLGLPILSQLLEFRSLYTCVWTTPLPHFLYLVHYFILSWDDDLQLPLFLFLTTITPIQTRRPTGFPGLRTSGSNTVPSHLHTDSTFSPR